MECVRVERFQFKWFILRFPCICCLSSFLTFLWKTNIARANYPLHIYCCVPMLLADLVEEEPKNNSSLLAHIANLPGFDASTARFATQYSTRSSPEKSVMEIVPTAAELMLPWRRDQSYQDREGGTFSTKKPNHSFLNKKKALV